MDDVWEEVDGAGLCGLYQLVWIFRSQYPAESFEQLRDRAKHALRVVLERDDTVLVRATWAASVDPTPVDPASVRDDDFEDIPESGEYVAIATTNYLSGI